MASIARSGELRTSLRSGAPKLGIFLQMADPLAVEVIGRAGFDFAVLDFEHGSLDVSEAASLARAADIAGPSLIARVPLNRLAEVSQLLDSGCAGILVPRVQTAAEAEAVVRACRYAPLGNRGVCPGTRANDLGWLTWQEHVERADARVLVAVAIEDPVAVASAPEILSVPGLDVAFVGVFDLAAELGTPGEVRHERVLRAVADIVATARRHGVQVGAVAESVPAASEWFDMGLRFLPISTDVLLWRETCVGIVTAWRGGVFAAAG